MVRESYLSKATATKTKMKDAKGPQWSSNSGNGEKEMPRAGRGQGTM